MALSEVFRKESKRMASDYLAIELTDAQLEALCTHDPDLAPIMMNWGMDTEAREFLADAIMQDVLGRDWPLNCEDLPPDFFMDFYRKAENKGYRVLWEQVIGEGVAQ